MKIKLLMAMVALPAAALAQTEVADTLTTPGYEMLDEVVVEAEKPVVQSDGAKLTYNVEEDPASQTSSAMDILKKVPQVSVDADGNVRLNGSTAFKFQLNGLDNPMLKQYAGQVLESTPASAIVKIEVITEPGAKEDAEGVAGIINIITERTGRSGTDGATATASLRVDNRSLTPSAYGLMKKDKVTLSANAYYQWGFAPQKGEQETTATYLGGTQQGALHTVMGQRSKHHVAGGSLNMSWEPNPSNLFTMGFDIFYLDANLYSIYGTTERFSPAGALLWSFRQDGSGGMKMLNLSTNVSYRHNFGHEGNHLVLTYLFNFGRNRLGLDRWYAEQNNYDAQWPAERDNSLTVNRGHTVQADYANDFNSEHHLMEVGVKGIFRHNSALASYLYGETPTTLASFPELDSDIMQPQNIYAAYGSYTGNFGPFGLVAGLRYEHTLMGITDRLETPDAPKSFRNRLNDWVPNAALVWNFSAASNLRLSYQMRISRPSIDQVNPFSLAFTPYEVRRGNPDLTSERSNIVTLKYSKFGRVTGLSVGLEYNHIDNAISSFTYLSEREGETVLVTSYANIGRRREGALTGLFTWNIIRNMSLMVDGRLSYISLKAPSERASNHGWGGNIGANWNYAVADVWKFSAYGRWNARNLTVQGYSSGYYYYGVSASRDFLADKSLTLGVSANNFLQKKMNFHSYTATPEVIYDNNGRNLQAWSVGVSISWKFGSLNAHVKKTGVDVSNDDINKQSNQSQGSSL